MVDRVEKRGYFLKISLLWTNNFNCYLNSESLDGSLKGLSRYNGKYLDENCQALQEKGKNNKRTGGWR